MDHLRQIGILLPQAYKGGSLRLTKKLAELILRGTADDARVVLSVVKGAYDWRSEFAELLVNRRFSVRETVWKEAATDDLVRLDQLAKKSDHLSPECYWYPDDGGACLLDCDCWFLVSDRTMAPLVPLRPFAIFPLDFVQRYVPEIFADDSEYLWNVHIDSMQRNLRNAAAVVCTTPKTAGDAVSYGGVEAAKIRMMLPFLQDYEVGEMEKRPALEKPLGDFIGKPFFVWPTNITAHKNHTKAIAALIEYYQSGGTLRCVVVGPYTDALREVEEEQSESAKLIIAQLRKLQVATSQVLLAGELSEQAYWWVLRRARFLWHNVVIDNGTYSVMEASMVNVPSLSSDYPQMRYYDDLFKLNLKYFPAEDVKQSAAALHEMEQATANTANLPSTTISFPTDYQRKLDLQISGLLSELVEAKSVCLT